jgi:hypothetical protein
MDRKRQPSHDRSPRRMVNNMLGGRSAAVGIGIPLSPWPHAHLLPTMIPPSAPSSARQEQGAQWLVRVIDRWRRPSEPGRVITQRCGQVAWAGASTWPQVTTPSANENRRSAAGTSLSRQTWRSPHLSEATKPGWCVASLHQVDPDSADFSDLSISRVIRP